MVFPKPYAKSTLKSLYNNLALPEDTVSLLHRYFDAMSNLYGVIPLIKAFSIIKRQNRNLISKEKFIEFSNIARREKHQYHILGLEDLYRDEKTTTNIEREIIHSSMVFIDNDNYYHTVEIQDDKPYYVPPKKELLKYSDESYFEETEYTGEMLRFIKNDLVYEDGSNPDDETAKDIFMNFIIITKAPVNKPLGTIKSIMEEIDRLKLAFESDKKARSFIELYNDLHNTTRMAVNRGHTPDEIASIIKPEDRIPKSMRFGPNIQKKLQEGEWDINDLRRLFMEMDVPSEELRLSMLRNLAEIENSNTGSNGEDLSGTVKPGRNDPCPCGSGKKYKKCCGR